MNRIRRQRLIDSKWTDLAPVQADKHFVVTRVDFGESANCGADTVELRAVISRRTRIVSIEQLSDETRWLPDWR